jgi:ribosomal protein S13
MQWLKSQQVYQLHLRPPTRVPTKSIAVSKPKKHFQADLTGPLPRDQGYNYVFAIIDVNSKMLYTRPLKTKTAAEVAIALSEVIAANDLTISVIQSDNGTEFHSEFQELLQQSGIRQTFSQTASPWINGVIERSHGTWKQIMYKYWSMSKTKKWKAILPSFTSNYNNTIHRSLKMTPNKAAALPPGALVKLNEKIGDIDKPVALFQIGDRVRLRLKTENKLEKEKQYYSDQRYTIFRVIKGSPTRLEQYQIKSERGNVVQGYFNASDLLDANISKLPPKKAAKRSKTKRHARPLPIRGQAEVDALLEHSYHRPPSVRGEYVVEKIIDSRKRAGKQEYLENGVGILTV